MFTSLEVSNHTSGKYRPRLWSVGWKLISRRFLSQLICRLPLLALWTLTVILILYKSLNSSIDDKNNKEPTQARSRLTGSHHQEKLFSANNNPTGRLLIRPPSPHYSNQRYHASDDKLDSGDVDLSNVITKFSDSLLIDSTTKKSDNEYARLSKVFILIVQNENFHPLNPSKIYKNNYHRQSTSKGASYSGLPVQHFVDSTYRINLPAHIRVLIEILKAHKIEYTIDTTRTGLPTTLLTDQDGIVGDMKQYSVIVIDDFVKYTKLSRWIRDQLDRHCRNNQIGVVTYLTPIKQQTGQTADYSHRSSSASDYRHTMPSKLVNSVQTTEEALADQFPLAFKPIDKKLCHKSLMSSSCLQDYQLNERSSILRVLKRKQNFILRGPLESNLDQLPWVSMSSNHITYEPLTWAKPQSIYPLNMNEMQKLSVSSASASVSTQERDQSPSSVKYNSTSLNSSPGIIVDELALEAQQSHAQANSTIRNHNPQVNLLPSSVSSSSDHSDSVREDGFGLDDDPSEHYVLSMFDRGLYDGIKRVIFGGANHHWLNRVLLLEAIEHLSSGRILSPLERYIQIDIDDIFVGETGKRMNTSDVDALVETQNWLAQRINGGFKFNLGFSGKYFKRGRGDEINGDEQLVSKANKFTWFCHSWSHSKAHLSNGTQSIVDELQKNLDFAKEHQLPMIGYEGGFGENSTQNKLPPTYAVAPHHSGVYPIHEPLYQAWQQVLNVQFTSTEEYPSLRPASGRRAFVHKAIQVLPRQTCGLYTHTIFRDRYPGGFAKLERNIRGGELFETVLHNPVNIYMTHMSNYANDRLAPYTFMELVDFVQSYTNLELKYAPSTRIQSGPSKLAEYYFNLYPNERQPLWTNPCNDKRHLDIWAPEKHKYCSIVPKLLIVGPQKTGTTALYSFLKLNPLFKSSLISPTDFEEVQFFNDKHYFKGVDWYLSRFSTDLSILKPEAEASDTVEHVEIVNSKQRRHQQRQQHENFRSNEQVDLSSFYFDKSATYFDDPKAPKRASHLLPEARIVILLVNPADRAYSWYQHIKAHGDKTANSVSFERVITAKDGDFSESEPGDGAETEAEIETGNKVNGSALSALRNRCLHPGYYSDHLSRWLEYYPSRQIIIIDGQWFRHNPISVMNRLQLLLRIEQPLDYGKLLVYNEQKGFFCQRYVASNHHNQVDTSKLCLGSSKGRKYEPMSDEARLILNRHYLAHNKQLARILSGIGQPLPTWLDESLSSSRVNKVIYWSS